MSNSGDSNPQMNQFSPLPGGAQLPTLPKHEADLASPQESEGEMVETKDYRSNVLTQPHPLEEIEEEEISQADEGGSEEEPESQPEQSQPEPQKKPWYHRKALWVGLGIVAMSGSLMGYGGWKFYRLYQNLPEVGDLSAFSRGGTLTIKAADGSVLMQRGPATRDKVALDKIPQELVRAFIATEDRRFYQHNGVDYQGIVRALASNVMAGGVVEGGSTITQQLARIVFLNQERSITRKLREALLAQKIEKQMSKEEILEHYLNLVYLGSGAYGVADAAQVYFSKPVGRLTLSEVAVLAGLPPAPSQYSPLVDIEAATQRRNVVLQRMQDDEVISAQRAQQVSQQALKINQSSPKRLQVRAPYFTSYIEKELPKYVSSEDLEIGGLTVETSVNLKWQEIAQKVVKEAVEIDGASEGFDQAALVSIDSRTGEVKALVGGSSFKESEFNRAIQAQRQPGSTFKGLVYATAIAAGFSPYDSYKDEPYRVDGYRPMNYGNRHSNNWRSMVSALGSSVNVVAVKVLVDVGFDPTIKLAKDMGIRSKLLPTYALALGAYEVNLLELTSAYGTFAAEGNYTPVHGIRRVINQQGEVVYEAKFKPKRVLDKNSAAITTWMLEGVVDGGTGRAAYLYDRGVAGKTGTSEKARDLWFIGYIPQVVTGVWLGNDDNQPTWGTSETAAFNWRQFMKQAVKDIPVEEFPKLPKLEGRKGSIKAKPVKPNRIVRGSAAIQKDDPDYYRSRSRSNSGYYNDGYYNDGYYNDGYY